MQDIYVNMRLSKLHVNIIILHVDILILHVDIRILHVGIICRKITRMYGAEVCHHMIRTCSIPLNYDAPFILWISAELDFGRPHLQTNILFLNAKLFPSSQIKTCALLSTAAIFFQMIILSMHLYTSDECHTWFHLYGTSRPARSALKAAKWKRLAQSGTRTNNPEIWSMMLYQLS